MTSISVDTQVWKERWNAHLDLFAGILERARQWNYEFPNTHRGATIAALLEHLGIFGDAQFDFYICAIEKNRLALLSTLDSEKQPDLVTYQSIAYPVSELIFDVTIQQFANDMMLLDRALSQRLSADPNITTPLAQFDLLASRTLGELPNGSEIQLPFGSAPTVLCYFQRDINVRILPYAPVALIGVSPAAKNVPRDLLVIPHELGHYLYWHGINKDGLKYYEILPAQNEEGVVVGANVRQWIVEVFADVVGVLLAGPVVAHSMMEISQYQIGRLFEEGTGSHPPAAVRPFVYIAALRKIGELVQSTDLESSASQLDSVWKQVLENRNAPENLASPLLARRLTGAVVDSTQTLSVDEYRAELEELVDEVLAMFSVDWIRQRFKVNVDGKPTVWTSDFSLDDPYGDFEEWIRQNLPLSIDFQAQIVEFTESPSPTLWDELVATHARYFDLALEPTDLQVLLDTAAPDTIPPHIWLRMLRFAGWTTEGPNIKGHD